MWEHAVHAGQLLDLLELFGKIRQSFLKESIIGTKVPNKKNIELQVIVDCLTPVQ